MKQYLVCTALLTVALAACNRAPEPDTSKADPQAAVKPTPATPARPGPADGLPGRADAAMPARDTKAVDAKLVGVRTSKQGDTMKHTLGAPTERFGPTDTVYAEVQTTGTAADYTLYAKWLAADGTVLSDYGMRIAEAGPKRTVISLSKPDGWQKGEHAIQIAINGQPAESVKFQVE